jgi:spore coat polysaccharide biosynthesis protein SpsF
MATLAGRSSADRDRQELHGDDMCRVVAVVQARMTSTRLPGKVMLPLAGTPLLARVLERVGAIKGIDETIIAVPEGPSQAPLVDLAAEYKGGVSVFQGSENDVLARTVGAAESANASVVIRITSDCPMFDPAVSSSVLAAFMELDVSYARTSPTHGYPLGYETEVISMEALRSAAGESSDPYEREHVTPFVWRRPTRFSAVHLACVPDYRSWRLTVDTPEDYALACHIYDELFKTDPVFGLNSLTRLFARRPDLLEMNAHVEQTPLLSLGPDHH